MSVPQADPAPSTKSDQMKALGTTLLREGLKPRWPELSRARLARSSGLETFIAAGVAIGASAWSMWLGHGRPILISELEVWKAQAMARADALKKNRIALPTRELLRRRHHRRLSRPRKSPRLPRRPGWVGLPLGFPWAGRIKW